jgi:hypothetical protein
MMQRGCEMVFDVTQESTNVKGRCRSRMKGDDTARNIHEIAEFLTYKLFLSFQIMIHCECAGLQMTSNIIQLQFHESSLKTHHILECRHDTLDSDF